MSNTNSPQASATKYHRCGAAVTDDNLAAWSNGFYSCEIEIDDPNDDGNFWQVCTTHDTLVNTVTLRTATINAKNVGWGSDPLKVVNAYLPSNYWATQEHDEITVVGYDKAGWTLDAYVIPRLASGMIFATEVK